MATRTFLIIPRKGGNVREIHVSLWIFFSVVFFLIVGAFGLYWLGGDGAISQEQKERIQTKQNQNRQLENRYKNLSSQLVILRQKIIEIGTKEKEIREIAGLQKDESKRDIKASSFFSFVTFPFQYKKEFSIEELLIEAQSIKTYYNHLHKQIVETPRAFERIPSFWPCGQKYTFISFGFGDRRDPFTGRILPHLGIDFPAPRGTRVFAAATGTVALIEQHKFFGKRIKIQHRNGFRTVYSHLNRFRVRKGQSVRKGQLIGTVGNSGYATGPHLHYEVLFRNVHQNAQDYLFPILSMTSL